MKYYMYAASLILIFIWSVGFIGYGLGGIFHGVLIIALLLAGTEIFLETNHRSDISLK